MTDPWYLTECHCMHGVECYACHERRVREAKPQLWRCPCGEDCEVVDYPTGVRSCGNVEPKP